MPVLHAQAQSDYRVFIDRDFFLAHWGMPELEFSDLLRVESKERYKKANPE